MFLKGVKKIKERKTKTCFISNIIYFFTSKPSVCLSPLLSLTFPPPHLSIVFYPWRKIWHYILYIISLSCWSAFIDNLKHVCSFQTDSLHSSVFSTPVSWMQVPWSWSILHTWPLCHSIHGQSVLPLIKNKEWSWQTHWCHWAEGRGTTGEERVLWILLWSGVIKLE